MTRLAEMPAVAVFSCAACGTTQSVPKSIDEIMPASPSVRGTVRIVRFTLVYLAVVMTAWAVALSHLSFFREIAVVVLAVVIGGGAFGGHFPPTGSSS